MVSNGRARNVDLIRNVNGSNTITFSVLLRYPSYNEFHPDALDKNTHITKGEFVRNPIVDLLQAETKLKMRLPKNKQNGEDEWLEFLIKKIEEDSTTGEIRYTATDLFINELARTGYNLSFSTEAGNNMGTAWELTEKILEDSDWVLDKNNSDRIQNDEKKQFEFYYMLYQTQSNRRSYLFKKNNAWTSKFFNDGSVVLLPSFTNINENTTILEGYLLNYRIQYESNYNTDSSWISKFYLNKIKIGDNSFTIDEIINLILEAKEQNNLASLLTPIIIELSNGLSDFSEDKIPTIYERPRNDGSPYASKLFSYQRHIELPGHFSTAAQIGWDKEENKIYELYTTRTIRQQLQNTGRPQIAKRFTLTRSFSPHFPQSLIEGEDIPNLFNREGLQSIPLNSFNNLIDKLKNDYFLLTCDTSSFFDKHELPEVTTDGLKWDEWNISYNMKKNNTTISKVVPLTIIRRYSNSDLRKSSWAERFGLPNDIGYALGKIDDKHIKDFINDIQAGAFNLQMQFQVLKRTVSEKDYFYPSTGVKVNLVSSFLENITNSTEYQEKLMLMNPDDLAKEEDDAYNILTPIFKQTVVPEYTYKCDWQGVGTKQYKILEQIENLYYYEGNQLYFYDNSTSQYIPLSSSNYNNVSNSASLYIKDFEYHSLGQPSNSFFKYPVIDPYNQKVTQIEEQDSNRFNLLQTICENFKCWIKINVQHDKDGRLKTQKWYFDPRVSDTLNTANGYFSETKGVFNYIKGLKSLGAILAETIYKAAEIFGIKIPSGSDKPENYVGTFLSPIKSIQLVNVPNPTETSTTFDYGKNLNSIKRTVNSEQISTYIIVEDNEVQAAPSGVCSIRDAQNNPSMENTIINFDYYVERGLLNKNEVYKDLYGNPYYDKNNLCYYWFMRNLNNKFKLVNDEYNAAADQLMELKASVDTMTNMVSGSYDNIIKENNKLSTTTSNKIKLDVGKIMTDLQNKTVTVSNIINALQKGNQGYFINQTYKKVQYNPKIDTQYPRYYYVKLEQQLIEDIEQYRSITELTEKELANVKKGITKVYTPVSNDSKNEAFFQILNNKSIQNIFTGLTEFLTKYQDSYSKATTLTTIYVTKKARVEILEQQLKVLADEKKLHYNKFYQKYQAYIQEGLWSETIYVNSDQYYSKALDVAAISAKPQITYDIQVVDLSPLDSYEIGDNKNYNFELGQKTYVIDPYFFGVNQKEEVIITEIAYNFDNPEQTKITVQNYRTRFEDLFQRISASVQSLQYADYAYNKISNIVAPDGTILLDNLQQAINRNGITLKNVSGQEIVQNETGITITSKYEPQKMLRIIADGIYVSRDSGNTFVNALSIDGISADVITSGVLDTQQIVISNGDKATFKWDSDGLTAFKWGMDDDNNISVDLSKFVRYDQYGIYGVDTLYYGWVAKDEADIETNARFGLTWNGFFFNAKPDWNTPDSFIKGTVRFDGLGLYGIPIEYTVSDWTKQLKEKDSTVEQMKYVQDNAIFGALWSGFFIRGNSNNYTTLINGDGFLMQYKETDKEPVNLIELGLTGGEMPTDIIEISSQPNDWKINYYNYYKDAKCSIPVTRKQSDEGELDPTLNYVPKEVLNKEFGTNYAIDQTLAQLQSSNSEQFLEILQMMVGIIPSPEGYTKETVVYPAWEAYTSVYQPSEMMKIYGVRFNDKTGNALLDYNAVAGTLKLRLNSLNIEWGNIRNSNNQTLNNYIDTTVSNQWTQISDQLDQTYVTNTKYSGDYVAWQKAIKELQDKDTTLDSNLSTVTEGMGQIRSDMTGILTTFQTTQSRNLLQFSRYYAPGLQFSNPYWKITQKYIGGGVSSDYTDIPRYAGPPSGYMSYCFTNGNIQSFTINKLPIQKNKYYVFSFYYRGYGYNKADGIENVLFRNNFQEHGSNNGGVAGAAAISYNGRIPTQFIHRYDGEATTKKVFYRTFYGPHGNHYNGVNKKDWARYFCIFMAEEVADTSDSSEATLLDSITIRCGIPNRPVNTGGEISNENTNKVYEIFKADQSNIKMLHEFSSFQLEEISQDTYWKLYSITNKNLYNFTANPNTNWSSLQQVYDYIKLHVSPWVVSASDDIGGAYGLVLENDQINLVGIATNIKLSATQSINVQGQVININGLGQVNIAGQGIDLHANNEIRLSTGNQGKIIFDTPKFQWQEASIGMEIDTSDRKKIQLKLGNWQVTKDNLQRVEPVYIHTSIDSTEVAYDENLTNFTFSEWIFKYLQEPVSDEYTFEKARTISSKKPEYLLPIYSPLAMTGDNANKFYGKDNFIYWAVVEKKDDGSKTTTIIDPTTYLIYFDDILRRTVSNDETYVLYWRETKQNAFTLVNMSTINQIQNALAHTNTSSISSTPTTFKDACRLSLKCVIDYYIKKDENNNLPSFTYVHESEIITDKATHLIGEEGIKITTKDNGTLLKLDGSESGVISRWKIDGNLTIGGDGSFFPQDCDYMYFDYNFNEHKPRTVTGIRSLIAEGGVLISANYGDSTMRLQGKVIDLWTNSVYIRQIDPTNTDLNYAPGNYGILYREPTGRVLLLNGNRDSDYGIAVQNGKNNWGYRHGGHPGGGGIICVDGQGVPYIWSWTDAINYWK